MPRARLEPEQDPIDRVNATKVEDAHGRPVSRLKWRVRLWDGSLKVVVATASTKGAVRATARKRTEDLLRTGRQASSWKPTSELTKYMQVIGEQAIDRAGTRDSSKKIYRAALAHLCEAFGPAAIHEAMTPRAVEDAIFAIQGAHGYESARQAKNVLSRYVVAELIKDGLIPGSPILPTFRLRRPDGPASTKVILEEEEWRKAIDWLLAADPEEVVNPGVGGYSKEARVRHRRSVIELTALQAATGLRFSEDLSLTWDRLVEDDKGIKVEVTTASKTHRARSVPVVSPAVVDRLRKRREREGGDGTGLVFPAPTTDGKPWDDDNARRAVKRLLVECAHETGLEKLDGAATHFWRHTLSTIAAKKGVAVDTRALWFGHSAAVNSQRYTSAENVADEARRIMTD